MLTLKRHPFTRMHHAKMNGNIVTRTRSAVVICGVISGVKSCDDYINLTIRDMNQIAG